MKLNNSFRRTLLDQFLNRHDYLGHVLDVGGKKKNKRGIFRPLEKKILSWTYLNIDPNTEPDLLASAHKIPKPDHTFDVVFLIEVLEHLEEPEQTLLEIYRVLKTQGHLILSMPFLYAIHGDPDDFQRFTRSKLIKELKSSGFSQVSIETMGGPIVVIADLIMNQCQYLGFLGKLVKKTFLILSPMIFWLDDKIKNPAITSGWQVKAVK
jgi:SAM-dependent methyltransferase